MTVMLAFLLAVPVADYRALGTEPFWSLAIGRGLMRLEQLGLRPVVAVVPTGRSGPRRYVTRAMTVTIVRRACSDGMSDRTYPDTVTIRVGRRTLHGCGEASPIPPRAAAW